MEHHMARSRLLNKEAFLIAFLSKYTLSNSDSTVNMGLICKVNPLLQALYSLMHILVSIVLALGLVRSADFGCFATV